MKSAMATMPGLISVRSMNMHPYCPAYIRSVGVASPLKSPQTHTVLKQPSASGPTQTSRPWASVPFVRVPEHTVPSARSHDASMTNSTGRRESCSQFSDAGTMLKNLTNRPTFASVTLLTQNSGTTLGSGGFQHERSSSHSTRCTLLYIPGACSRLRSRRHVLSRAPAPPQLSIFVTTRTSGSARALLISSSRTVVSSMPPSAAAVVAATTSMMQSRRLAERPYSVVFMYFLCPHKSMKCMRFTTSLISSLSILGLCLSPKRSNMSSSASSSS